MRFTHRNYHTVRSPHLILGLQFESVVIGKMKMVLCIPYVHLKLVVPVVLLSVEIIPVVLGSWVDMVTVATGVEVQGWVLHVLRVVADDKKIVCFLVFKANPQRHTVCCVLLIASELV